VLLWDDWVIVVMLDDCHGGDWLLRFLMIAVVLEGCLLNAVILDDVGCDPLLPSYQRGEKR
jgi:hypothetical protein